ncbi:MAG TPA: thioesterase, partial [Prevotella sp.]|nr:thioesterase [Prevotella sp.]
QQLVGKDSEVKCIGETIMVLYDTTKGEKVGFTPEWRAMIEGFEGRKL